MGDIGGTDLPPRIPVDISRTDDTFGVGDLYPSASIFWNSGVNNYKLYATGDIPVGDYDPKRLANIGIGYGAIDGGGAYTYFNPETGHELSATLGFTYNFENTESQDYKNGIDMHLDWGASQWLSKTTMVGVAGYLYYQVTDDTYPTDTPLGQLRERFLGGFRSKVASVGPQFAHIFEVGGVPVYTTVRGYFVFWAEHRLQGESVFLQAVIPLVGRRKSEAQPFQEMPRRVSKNPTALFGSAILTVPLLLSPLAHAQFVIKSPAVEEGELAFVGHGSYESALSGGGDPVGWGHEVEVNYGFTDFWKSTLALELKQPVHEELEPTEFKFENYLELIDYPAHAVFSAFGAVNFGLEEGVARLLPRRWSADRCVRLKPYTREVRATIDTELVAKSIDFMKRQKAAGKPFFLPAVLDRGISQISRQ